METIFKFNAGTVYDFNFVLLSTWHNIIIKLMVLNFPGEVTSKDAKRTPTRFHMNKGKKLN